MNSPFQNGFSGFRKLTGDQFQKTRDILFDHSGIYFSDAKQYLLESRLNKRLNELKMSTFEDYMSYISQPLKQKKELSFYIIMLPLTKPIFQKPPSIEGLRRFHPSGIDKNPADRWKKTTENVECRLQFQ